MLPYSLKLPDSPWPKRWMLLAVGALAMSGLAPLLLLAGRASFLAEAEAVKQLFPVVLVVHVDLSVLIWFLAVACMFWAMISCRRPEVIPLLRAAAFACFAAGAMAIALSPLHSAGGAVMNNYIPVITNPVFFIGLSLVGCGVLLSLADLVAGSGAADFSQMTELGIVISGVVTLFSLAAFFWAGLAMPSDTPPESFYEWLFWGGGHLLQFTHVQLLLVCWLVLGAAAYPHFQPNRRMILLGMLCAVPIVWISPAGFVFYEVDSVGYIKFFSDHMRYFGGVAPLLVAVALLHGLLGRGARALADERALRRCLWMSVLLFGSGGVLGFLISGINVVIPAHYHGSIVGVTLAFMGAVYYLLPQFGYGRVTETKLAGWQPLLYGGGQLLHILGLAWAGGYGGVARKTAGALDAGQDHVALAMQLMRFGGLLAVIGGGLFVVVVWRSVYASRRRPAAAG